MFILILRIYWNSAICGQLPERSQRHPADPLLAPHTRVKLGLSVKQNEIPGGPQIPIVSVVHSAANSCPPPRGPHQSLSGRCSAAAADDDDVTKRPEVRDFVLKV